MTEQFLQFPIIDPIIFSIGPVALRWYGMMYLIGFLAAMYIANKAADNSQGVWTRDQVSDLLFYGFLGVILGGRVGYVLFYQFDYFLADPLYLFQIWQGGMSFHGGLIGVITAVYIFARKSNKPFLAVGDFVAPLVPIGLGMALSARIQEQSYNVLALLSDGECNEGSIWEAAMMAAAKKVDNLMVIIDFNKWQATGRSEEILALTPLVDKWRAFGWDACEIDGHDMGQLIDVLTKEKNSEGKPIAVIAHTVKGKGVSFMEDDNNWHYRIPSKEELVSAHKELGLFK